MFEENEVLYCFKEDFENCKVFEKEKVVFLQYVVADVYYDCAVRPLRYKNPNYYQYANSKNFKKVGE